MNAVRNRYIGLLYILPALIFVAAFVLYPLGRLVYISLTSASLLGGGRFIGLGNYVRAFNDATFRSALFFTIKYTIYITPILMILGFLLALLTAQNTRLKQFTRGVVFLPVVIGLGTSSLLWFWLFDQQVGLFNKLLVDLHIIDKPIVWFTEADVALWGVIISVTWKVVGFGMILFVASIQAIDNEISEAAMIDGAGYWQRVRQIIVPLSYRTILLTTLISAIGSMLAFDQFYIMTSGRAEGSDLHLGLLDVPELVHLLQTGLRLGDRRHPDPDHHGRRHGADRADAAEGQRMTSRCLRHPRQQPADGGDHPRRAARLSDRRDLLDRRRRDALSDRRLVPCLDQDAGRRIGGAADLSAAHTEPGKLLARLHFPGRAADLPLQQPAGGWAHHPVLPGARRPGGLWPGAFSGSGQGGHLPRSSRRTDDPLSGAVDAALPDVRQDRPDQHAMSASPSSTRCCNCLSASI